MTMTNGPETRRSSLATPETISSAVSGDANSRPLQVGSKSRKYSLTSGFNYREDSHSDLIAQVRSLLAIERVKQNANDYAFWTPDYERMMRDDWLVARFLVRGHKAALKVAGGACHLQERAPTKNGTSGEGLPPPPPISKQQMAPFLREATLFHTLKLIRLCAEFRCKFNVNASTKCDQFPKEWLEQSGIFAYKQDRAENPVLYLRCKLHKPKLIPSKELRHLFKGFLLFQLEQCDQALDGATGKGICCVFDMTSATFENLDLELVGWMIKSFKACSPKLLSDVIIYNLPWFFSATFKFISGSLLSSGGKQSVRFVYGHELLDYIERENLPDYLCL